MKGLRAKRVRTVKEGTLIATVDIGIEGKKRDVHAERASQEAWGGRILEDKDWEPEAAVGIGYIKISTWLGTSRTNVPIVPLGQPPP